MIKAVLISASFGDGHRQVARALREAFEHHDVQVYEVDSFKKTNRLFAGFQERMYEWITRHFSGMYGMTYRWTAKLPVNHLLWKILALSTGKGVEKAVRRIQPDIVLQLFPDYSTHGIRRRDGKPYIGIVLTDYSVHSHWFHTNADVYFIPEANLRYEVEPFKTDKIDVVEVGIPIRHQFHQPVSTVENTRSYILVATGGRGLFREVQEIVEILVENFPEFDIYILCGRNNKMLEMIQEQTKNAPRVHGLSYFEDIASLYRNASFAVIKAGGVTVSECLCSGCPMLFYRPDSGQELDNAKFMEKMGAGKITYSLDEFNVLISTKLLDEVLLRMREACASLARPTAADDIVQFVMSKIQP